MIPERTTPSSSPTSSTSSHSKPPSISLPTLEPEELEDNRFLTKDFIETHCFNASPYYRGQYQTVNGKVISIEQSLISTVSVDHINK
ncbi:unnamed protein product [Cunninghamella echinulata]